MCRRSCRIGFFGFVACVLLMSVHIVFVVPTICLADIYKYIDRSGTVVMTNKLESVPRQYLGKVTVIKETPAPRASSVESPATSSPAAPSLEPQEGGGENPGNWRKYLVPSGILIGLAGIVLLLCRIIGSMGGRSAGKIILLVIVIVIGIYGYQRYISHMSEVFAKLKIDAQNIKKNVESRAEKTNNSLKQLQSPSGGDPVTPGKP